MTTDRCPACSAAVSPGAPWCTLCYADLRPRVPEPVAQPVAVAAAAPSAAPASLPPDPILDAPVVAAAPVARTGDASWPCVRCGAQVPMSDDVCGGCGASFLPSDSAPHLNLPGVGDVTRLEKPQRIMLVIGLGVAAMLVLLGIFFALGSFL